MLLWMQVSKNTSVLSIHRLTSNYVLNTTTTIASNQMMHKNIFFLDCMPT